jgi:hypothetical protein
MPIETLNSVIHAARSFLNPNIKSVLTHSVQTQ